MILGYPHFRKPPYTYLYIYIYIYICIYIYIYKLRFLLTLWCNIVVINLEDLIWIVMDSMVMYVLQFVGTHKTTNFLNQAFADRKQENKTGQNRIT